MPISVATPPALITCTLCEQEIVLKRCMWQHVGTGEFRCSK